MKGSRTHSPGSPFRNRLPLYICIEAPSCRTWSAGIPGMKRHRPDRRAPRKKLDGGQGCRAKSLSDRPAATLHACARMRQEKTRLFSGQNERIAKTFSARCMPADAAKGGISLFHRNAMENPSRFPKRYPLDLQDFVKRIFFTKTIVEKWKTILLSTLRFLSPFSLIVSIVEIVENKKGFFFTMLKTIC